MHLLVVTHVRHYQHEGRLFAYSPYAREIEIWADLFDRVVIAAPASLTFPESDAALLDRPNIELVKIPEIDCTNVRNIVRTIFQLPSILWLLIRAIRAAGAVHVRCPGNLGLLGVVLAPLLARRMIAKYAGDWGAPRPALSYRLQRWLLGSPWWRGPVTVYGSHPSLNGRVTPFFTSILTEEQLKRASRSARPRRARDPLRVLYLGRLTEAKNVDTLLHSLSLLAQSGCRAVCRVVGDGPHHPKLVRLARDLNIDSFVQFPGGLPYDKVIDNLEWADTLVLVSSTEGWPKAIAEAMAFQVICVGSTQGLVPEMLAGGRGFIVPPRNAEALAAALRSIATAEDLTRMRADAAEWASRYSIERLRDAIRQLLETSWDVQLRRPSLANAPAPEPGS